MPVCCSTRSTRRRQIEVQHQELAKTFTEEQGRWPDAEEHELFDRVAYLPQRLLVHESACRLSLRTKEASLLITGTLLGSSKLPY